MIRDLVPKISCVTVTTGRVDHVKNSTQCYLSQTYPNRELVILSQGDDAANKEILGYVKSLGRDDIMFLTADPRISLGAMRNASCELATSTIICQWDDDDLYHPDRIKAQYLAMTTKDYYVASAYPAFLKYFKDSGELYWCDWWGEGKPACQLLCGSVMFYKKFFYEWSSVFYPEGGGQCHVEEDLNVLYKLLSKGEVAAVSEGHHYIYTFHGENTYGLKHHQLTLLTNSGKKILSVDELLQRQALLSSTFELVGLDGPVKVRSFEEVAFTYPTE